MNPRLSILNNDYFVGEMCFNPSLIGVKKNKKKGKEKEEKEEKEFSMISAPKSDCILIYRTTPTLADWYESSIRCTILDLSTSIPKYSQILPNISKSKNIELVAHGEDPRILPLENGILISYTNVDRDYTSAKIEVASFRDGLTDQGLLNKNVFTFDVDGRPQEAKEKNWLFFTPLNQVTVSTHIYIIYNLQPLVLLKSDLDLNEILSTEDGHQHQHHDTNKQMHSYRTKKIKEQNWRHPLSETLRLVGGTPPLYVDDKYFMFAHSKNYRVFAIIMNSELEITRVSQKPVIPHRFRGDIMFPCGAIFEKKTREFQISIGLNDQFMGIIKVSLEYIEDVCIDVLNLE